MRANVNLILAVCAYLRLALLAFAACGAGLLLGGPLAWGLWQLFRQFLAGFQELVLCFNPWCCGYALDFAAYNLAPGPFVRCGDCFFPVPCGIL